jgi:N-acetyltransferase
MDLLAQTDLVGEFVRLEPLEHRHAPGLATAYAADPLLYRWTFVPQDEAGAAAYVDTALRLRAAGAALPFATVRTADGAVIGSTRLLQFEYWDWPAGHPRRGGAEPDACEIGYTWLTRSAIRTAANTEAKLLMLGLAFESWAVLRVCFHTDARNERSRAALEGIGAQFEGVLRSYRVASDNQPRDSARYSIIASEWPGVKERLTARLHRCTAGGDLPGQLAN